MQLYLLTVFFFCSNAVLTVILPLQGDSRGLGQGEIALMMGAYMFTCMLFRPLAGRQISRYGAVKIMRGLVIVHAVCLLLYMLPEDNVLWLSGLRALQGAVTAFFSMTMQLGIVEKLAAKDRAQGMSLYTLSTMFPQLFIPIAAVGIWQSGEWSTFAGVLLALALATGVIGFTAPLPAAPLGGGTFTLREMAGSFTQLWRSRDLFVCSVIMLAVSSMYSAISTVLPVYMEKTGVGNAGLYLMLQGFTVVASRFVLRKRLPSDGRWDMRLIAGLLLSAAAGSQLLAMLESAGPLIYISAVLNGLAIALMYPTLVTYLSFVLPSQSRAVLLGLFISSYDLGFSLGGVLMGMAAQWFTYSGMFTICALSSLSVLIIVLLNKNRMSISPDKYDERGTVL
jgi:MFS family permease